MAAGLVWKVMASNSFSLKERVMSEDSEVLMPMFSFLSFCAKKMVCPPPTTTLCS